MEHNHKNIAHAGVVEQVNAGQLLVRIQPQSACGNCQSHSHCSMADNSGKLVEVALTDGSSYALGQQVTLFLQEKLGYRALMLGYLLPFLILLVSLIVMLQITGNEGLSALVAVLLMAPYYGLLYRFRGKLRKTFEFRVK